MFPKEAFRYKLRAISYDQEYWEEMCRIQGETLAQTYTCSCLSQSRISCWSCKSVLVELGPWSRQHHGASTQHVIQDISSWLSLSPAILQLLLSLCWRPWGAQTRCPPHSCTLTASWAWPVYPAKYSHCCTSCCIQTPHPLLFSASSHPLARFNLFFLIHTEVYRICLSLYGSNGMKESLVILCCV